MTQCFFSQAKRLVVERVHCRIQILAKKYNIISELDLYFLLFTQDSWIVLWAQNKIQSSQPNCFQKQIAKCVTKYHIKQIANTFKNNLPIILPSLIFTYLYIYQNINCLVIITCTFQKSNPNDMEKQLTRIINHVSQSKTLKYYKGLPKVQVEWLVLHISPSLANLFKKQSSVYYKFQRYFQDF